MSQPTDRTETLPAIDSGVCRVCGTQLSPPVIRCPACETPHHRDCWDYNRGCAIYGCHVAKTPGALTAAPDLVIAAALSEEGGPTTTWPRLPWERLVLEGCASGVVTLYAVLSRALRDLSPGLFWLELVFLCLAWELRCQENTGRGRTPLVLQGIGVSLLAVALTTSGALPGLVDALLALSLLLVCWDWIALSDLIEVAGGVRIDLSRRAEASRHRKRQASVALVSGLMVAYMGGALAGVVVTLVLWLTLASLDWVRFATAEASRNEMIAFRQAQDEKASLDLERKAVLALVGRAKTDQLAQAYALLEQRHPGIMLEPELQQSLAVELADAGWMWLGLNALEKCLRTQSGSHADLERRRYLAYLRDPALASRVLWPTAGRIVARTEDESARDKAPAPRESGPVGLEPQVADRLREAMITAPAGARPCMVVSLRESGFGRPVRDALAELAGQYSETGVPGRWIAGPFPTDALPGRFDHWWRTGDPTILVEQAVFDFPARVTAVRGLHLSNHEVRFMADSQEWVFSWADVRTVVYERVGPAAWAADDGTLPVAAAARVGQLRSTLFVEFHAGDPVERFRIDLSRASSCEYLGRRRQPSQGANAALVAKDVVRFGPAVRISQGLEALVTGHLAQEGRLDSPERFEEYVLWLVALGSRSVVARWSAALGDVLQ